MVRSLLALTVLLLLGMTRPATALQVPVVDQSPLSLTVQDGTGQIWGGINGTLDPLVRWQSGRWTSIPFKPLEWGSLVAATRVSDGAVLCVWRRTDETYVVTRHHGHESRLIARITGGCRTSGLLPDSQGGAWMLGHENRIRHVTRDGIVRTSYTVPPPQYYAYGRPHGSSDSYEPLYATEDGQQRLWVWTDYLAGYVNYACLHGVLIWDGHSWTHHPTLDGVPDKPFDVIVPKDADHLWVAVPYVGLYLVDTRTLHGTRVPAPEAGAFKGVERIFRDGEDWYVLDWANTDSQARWVNAWRLRQGRWRKVVQGIDTGAEYEGQPRRAWIGTAQGVYLASFGGGVYWIPHGDGQAHPIDWRSGFPLTSVSALYPLPQGRCLGVEESNAVTGSVVLPLVPRGVLSPASFLRTVPMNTDCSVLVPDNRGELWGLPSLDHGTAIGEWDGRRWLFHTAPPLIRHQTIDEIATDNRRRIWLWSRPLTGRVFLFDAASQRWIVYPSFHAALLAQSASPNLILTGGQGTVVPRFRADGQCASYQTPSGLVAAYDGRNWHRWTVPQITGGTSIPDLKPPFFDRVGGLCVDSETDSHTWRWDQTLGWQKSEFVPGPSESSPRLWNFDSLRDAVHGAPALDSAALDDQGNYWFVSDRRLYKTLFGRCALRLPGIAIQPFLDGRRLEQVLHDSVGGTWLGTNGGWSSEYVYLPPVPVAVTKIHLRRGQLGSIDLHFTTPGRDKWLYVWRLDGGAWDEPQALTDAHLSFLSNGPHRVEVLALNSRLDTPPTPARLTFVVDVDPAQQMAYLIAILEHGTDNAREVAVAALRNQPDFGLSALRAARVTADEDGRWWIDAAIQQADEMAGARTGQTTSP
jgi:hypothetical protein